MTGKRVFVSYCHQQEKWVWSDLVPCLRAGGVEVLIDKDRFTAGKGLIGQMDVLQDSAEATLAILSPGYMASVACVHELDRAVARDPNFLNGTTIPAIREPCVLPGALVNANPLWIDFSKSEGDAWKLLLKACSADLGCTATHWLEGRDEVLLLLGRGQSVNLVVPRSAGSLRRPRWRELINHLQADHLRCLGIVDLERGTTASRPGLVAAILSAVGRQQPVPTKPADLGVLDRALSGDGRAIHLALLHFDNVATREVEYGVDLCAALRDLVERRQLVLLIQSRRSFVELLPKDHPLSSLTQLQTVELGT